MKIKDITSIKEFISFCEQTPATTVQKFTTYDWLNVYQQIEKIRQKQNPGSDSHGFMVFIGSALSRLYKNYRMETEHVEALAQLADEAVERLCRNYPQILDDIRSIEIDKNNFLKEKLAERVVQSIYNSAYFDRFSKTMLRPRVLFQSKMNEERLGAYDSATHQIVIERKAAANPSTLAHEVYHSLQGVRKVPYLLQQLGIFKGYEDASLNALYNMNRQYYVTCAGRSDPAYAAYARQPLEYSALLFELLFTRKLNQKLNYSRQGFTALKTVRNILMDFNLKPRALKFEARKQQIIVQFDFLRPREIELLDCLNSKYLKAFKKIENETISLEVPALYPHLRRLELAHRNIAKRFKEEAHHDYGKIFRSELGDYCYKYPASIEQKKQVKQKEQIELEKLDRKKHAPQIFKNLRDYIFERS